MGDCTHTKQLSPLDLTVPTAYINILFTFDTTESTPAVRQHLKVGLDALCKQLPWLTGRVFPSGFQGKQSLEIRYNTALSLIDKGSVAASYKTLSTQGMPPEAIPPDVWPLSPVIDDALAESGAPVFATSLFRFSDNGVGLCVCLHHNTVDATGFSEIIRQWARNCIGSGFDLSSTEQFGRIERLSEALSPQLQEISTISYDDLLARHSEYAKAEPAPNNEPVLPAESPPCTSKVFTIPIHRINTLKETLRKHTPQPPTTNVLLCALMWTAITRVRAHRNPSLADGSIISRLATIVNGRRRISETFSPPSNPYFGNVALYTRAESTAANLSSTECPDSSPESARSFTEICARIATSQSPSTINARHIAEVYRLINEAEDYRTLDPGWDIFGSRDLAVTSWADMDVYEADFGGGLGKPQFARLPYLEADGVGVVFPRRRDGADEVLEVMVMLRRDDMTALESDAMWRAVASAVGSRDGYVAI